MQAMPFALTTHWNAFRHSCGQEMVEEILALGFRHLELGYDLTIDLVPGVRNMVARGAVSVTSVHNYCPVPMGAPQGHPELFLMSSKDARERNSAILHLTNTIEFAASMGAASVVVHGGRVKMNSITRKLMALAEAGKQNDLKYDKIKQRLLLKRERKVGTHYDNLLACLQEVLPVLEKHQVTLALENLPSWEAIPSEAEMERIGKALDSPYIGYWHDVGHGQIRQNLGFVGVVRWLDRLQPYLRGFHIHDVLAPAGDHEMPPGGQVDFEQFKSFVREDMPLVLEPMPGTPAARVAGGLATVKQAWGFGL